VINVAGNRIGTEEIETAILLDADSPDSPVRNCAVVGMSDELYGTTPVAFLVPKPDVYMKPATLEALSERVLSRCSASAVPSRYVL
jgi:acrylyl-CoA reductase (NADPH)/3-hydroxypropionyl-CoA dehydratase/3-hydroxypropionyl-CoA synthetase